MTTRTRNRRHCHCCHYHYRRRRRCRRRGVACPIKRVVGFGMGSDETKECSRDKGMIVAIAVVVVVEIMGKVNGRGIS